MHSVSLHEQVLYLSALHYLQTNRFHKVYYPRYIYIEKSTIEI